MADMQGSSSPPAPAETANAAAEGAVAAPLALGFGCALAGVIFGLSSGWGLIWLAAAYVGGGVFGLLAGGALVMARGARG